MRAGPSPAGERTAFVGVVTVASAGVALWSAGEFGGWLCYGHWPPNHVSVAPILALAVLRHPAEPALAWSARARALLPPTWLLYALAALVLALGASLTVAVIASLQSLRNGGPLGEGVSGHGGRRPRPSGVGWARRRDLALLRVGGPGPGRLVLGRHPGIRRNRVWSLLATEARASVIVLGPSQSGKTSGLAVPAILEWNGPVLATSVKTDLVRDTLPWRQHQGRAWVYDPTLSTGLPASNWSPLGRCRDWQSARQVAAWLCGSARPRAGTMADDDFWYGAAAKLLAPHLLAAATGGRTIADVVRWIDAQDEEEVAILLEGAGVEEATRAAAASWARDDRTRSSIYTTAEMVLEAFADPTVAASACTCDIQASRLLEGGSTSLYICAPSHEQDRLRPVFATLVHEVLTAAFDLAGRAGRPLDPPLLVVLDEAANIAPLRDLDVLASTAASHGVQLLTVWQDLAQIQARYGDRHATVVNNHRAKLLLSGVSDPATLEYASRLLGEGVVGDASTTIDASGARSTTRAGRERRLLTDAELRRIKTNEAVLVYGHLRPARLQLRPWFRDATLRRRVRDPNPTGS
jgi:type IV secretion system protein VirD4